MTRRRSNTMGTKLKQQDSQTQKNAQIHVLEQPTMVKLHFRRTNKSSRMFDIPPIVNGEKISQIIEKEFYISEEKQIIFYKGKKTQLCPDTRKLTFNLTNQSIIHVHNKEIIGRETLSVHLQFINIEFIKFRQIKITAHSCETIISTFADVLMYEIEEIEGYWYLQSGRFINIANTYACQLIEDDSIIIVFNSKTKPHLISKFEQREMEIVDLRNRLTKRNSLINQDIEAPNFKKKIKCNVYKTIFIPESKQLIWRQESSSDLSKRVLAKKLIKKNKQVTCQIQKVQVSLDPETEINSNVSQFSNEDRSMDFEDEPIKILKNIEKRLFESASLNRKTEVKNLKPPAMLDDFFQEEVDEFDFGSGEMCDVELNDTFNLKNSAPLASFQNSLKNSIGKNRGVFVPIIGSENMDLDEDDDI